MVVSLISIVSFLFFSVCFSHPCPSLSACNTFAIQYPFCAYNESCAGCDDPANHACSDMGRPCDGSPIKIKCNYNDQNFQFNGNGRQFKLENISYNSSTFVIRDEYLGKLMRNSKCTNKIKVSKPNHKIGEFNYDKNEEQSQWFSSGQFQCDPETHQLHIDCEKHGWSCSYAALESNALLPCSDTPYFAFNWTFSFDNKTAGALTLLSASFCYMDCTPQQGGSPQPVFKAFCTCSV